MSYHIVKSLWNKFHLEQHKKRLRRTILCSFFTHSTRYNGSALFHWELAVRLKFWFCLALAAQKHTLHMMIDMILIGIFRFRTGRKWFQAYQKHAHNWQCIQLLQYFIISRAHPFTCDKMWPLTERTGEREREEKPTTWQNRRQSVFKAKFWGLCIHGRIFSIYSPLLLHARRWMKWNFKYESNFYYTTPIGFIVWFYRCHDYKYKDIFF